MQVIAVKRVIQKAETIFAATRTEPTDNDGLSRQDLLAGLVHLDTFAAMFWRLYFWPEWTIVEQRQFRQSWSSATTYAGPTPTSSVEVFHIRSGQYAQSLRDNNQNHPPFSDGGAWWAECLPSYSEDFEYAAGVNVAVGQKTRNPDDNRFYQCHTAHVTGATLDQTKWGILTPFQRTLATEQSWETNPIDAIRRVTLLDPRVTPGAETTRLEVDKVGDVYVVAGGSSIVFVRFRLRPPPSGWAATLFDPTRSYQKDDIVYADPPGDIFKANKNNPATGGDNKPAAADWDLVPFPYVFRDAVSHAIAGQWLKADGELAIADKLLNEAMDLAGMEFEEIERQQDQSGRIPMKFAI